jgi:anti-sigma regulatory factor (Ser/Thr protein kinase)
MTDSFRAARPWVSDRIPMLATLHRTVDAPRQAREIVRRAVPAERVADAELLVSELITNAVKYGGAGPVELTMENRDGALRCAIRDSGSAGPLPVMQEQSDDPGGHGLRLVDHIADRWGVEKGSTIVWFELDLG